MSKERETRQGCGAFIFLFLSLMFIFWVLDTPPEIEEASSTLNVALVLKSDKELVCAPPKKVSESWFTICTKFPNPYGSTGSAVWEISEDGSKVFAHNGPALRGLDDLGEQHVPADKSKKPLSLSRGDASSVNVTEVLEAFK